jgi:hypothetical protein
LNPVAVDLAGMIAYAATYTGERVLVKDQGKGSVEVTLCHTGKNSRDIIAHRAGFAAWRKLFSVQRFSRTPLTCFENLGTEPRQWDNGFMVNQLNIFFSDH